MINKNSGLFLNDKFSFLSFKNINKILKRNISGKFNFSENHLKNVLFAIKERNSFNKLIRKKISYKLKNFYEPKRFEDHYPVLWRNILELIENNLFNDIADTKNKLIGDLTIGAGNHSKLILENFDNSLILGVDLDKDMIKYSENKLKKYVDNKRVSIINDSYVDVDSIKIFDHFDISQLNNNKNKKFDFLLLDLGYNSLQIDSPKKGFSFKQANADLDMRYDQDNENKSRAADILNHCSDLELMEIFKTYAEEKYYEYLVKKIIEYRNVKIFYTVKDFVDVIDYCFYSKSVEKFDCYTRLFQALRIVVNYEILNIQRFLTSFHRQVEQGGIIAIISFHSIEDKQVKKYFQELEKLKIGKILYHKAIKPSSIELEENSRSKSAILRVFKFNIEDIN